MKAPQMCRNARHVSNSVTITSVCVCFCSAVTQNGPPSDSPRVSNL